MKIFKTIMKWVGIFFAFITICLSTLGITIAIITNLERKNDNYKSQDLANWMSYVDDDTNIRDIIMPGSHDAGSRGMLYLGETQHLSIEEQLNRGVRYFDIRVNKKDDKLVIFHSIINGCDFEVVTNEISNFISTFTTEFLILDFQHFKNGAEEETFSMLENTVGIEKLVVNNTNKTDIEFIDSLKLKDVRGKILVTVGKNEEELTKNYQFVRDNDEKERENSILHSEYTSENHYKKSKDFIKNILPSYIETQKERNNGIFVLQCQLTDKYLIFGPAFKEWQHDTNVSSYINSFRESEDIKYLNVIMRDFLNINKCADIIYLNLFNNSIKSSEEAKFSEIISKYITK